MFKLNETVLVANLTEALEGQEGVFLVTAPTGQSLSVRLGDQRFAIERLAYLTDGKRNDSLWAVTKLADQPRGGFTKKTAVGDSRAASS